MLVTYDIIRYKFLLAAHSGWLRSDCAFDTLICTNKLQVFHVHLSHYGAWHAVTLNLLSSQYGFNHKSCYVWLKIMNYSSCKPVRRLICSYKKQRHFAFFCKMSEVSRYVDEAPQLPKLVKNKILFFLTFRKIHPLVMAHILYLTKACHEYYYEFKLIL